LKRDIKSRNVPTVRRRGSTTLGVGTKERVRTAPFCFERRNIISLPPRNPFTNFTIYKILEITTGEAASRRRIILRINSDEIGAGWEWLILEIGDGVV